MNKTLQTRILELLQRKPATAEVLSILLDGVAVDAIERELEALFANSKVEALRRDGEAGTVYRLVAR